MEKFINVIGGGLAGSEAAYQIAKRGINVKLYEMKPVKFSPAHSNPNLAEIVLLYGSVVLAVTFIVTWSPTFNAVFGLILSVTVSKLFVVYMVPLVLLSWHVILLEQLYEI